MHKLNPRTAALLSAFGWAVPSVWTIRTGALLFCAA